MVGGLIGTFDVSGVVMVLGRGVGSNRITDVNDG